MGLADRELVCSAHGEVAMDLGRIRGLVVAAIVAGSLATSAHAVSPPSPIVLYGPEGPDPVLEARALAAFNLLAPDRRVSPSVRHVDTALAEVPDVGIAGIGDVRTCPGSPVSLAEFRATLTEAEGHVLYGRRGEAELTLERLDALLACLHEVLPRQELAWISFLEGLGHAFMGEEAEARESFRQALVVAPALEWDSRFPPESKAIFDEAIRDALRTPTVPLEVEPRLGALAELWIDGEPFPTGGGISHLAAGRHLLQWRDGDGGFGTRVMGVEEGDRLTVSSRLDVSAAVISGRGSEASRGQAIRTLQTLAEEAANTPLYLVELGEVDLLHRFDPATGRWEHTDSGAVARRVIHQRTRRIGQVSIVTGGVVAAIGAVVGTIGYVNAKNLYDNAYQVGSQQQYSQDASQYQRDRTQSQVGFLMTGIGGTAIAIGIPLAATGSRGDRVTGNESVAVRARLHLAPSACSISVRF